MMLNNLIRIKKFRFYIASALLLLLNQAKMWRKKEAEEQRKSFLESLCDIKDIVIYCKNCQQMLCYGTDLRKRGPQFVAYSEELEKKVHTSKSPVPAVFRLETHIGKIWV